MKTEVEPWGLMSEIIGRTSVETSGRSMEDFIEGDPCFVNPNLDLGMAVLTPMGAGDPAVMV